MTAPEPPAVPPAETEIPDFWWSTTGGLFYDINHPTSKVLNLVYADCARPITAPLRELPAEAVRLVPEPEVLPLQVEVRNARKQHAADSEEIAELRGHIQELEAALRTELSRSTPGSGPDTGQAREPIQRGRWTEERNALAGKLLDHLLDYEAALGRLPVDDVDGAMAVRLANVVLSAGWQPPGDTVQARWPRRYCEAVSDREASLAAADRLDATAEAINARGENWTGNANVARSLARLFRNDALGRNAEAARALLGTDTTPEAGRG